MMKTNYGESSLNGTILEMFEVLIPLAYISNASASEPATLQMKLVPEKKKRNFSCFESIIDPCYETLHILQFLNE